MGGFVKISIREKSGITTRVVGTNELNIFLGSAFNLIEGDVSSHIVNNSVRKELFEEDAKEEEMLFPFNYGYIFIDRLENKLWYCNDFCPLSFYSNYDFKKETYLQLKNQKFKVEISKDYNSKTNTFKSSKAIDVREESLRMEGLDNYFKLHKALPYLSNITYKDENINDISTIESVLEGIFEKQDKVKKENNLNEKGDFSFNVNYDIQLHWSDWDVKEDDINTLYEYLLEKDLLTDLEISKWKNYLKDK
jgi:hypothetical protein